MAIIEEPFVPGVYAADLDGLQIRTKRDTTLFPTAGSFKKDDMFPVFEVFPEEKGILWGRISSNVDGQTSRFVGLRVNNHIKAHLVQPFSPPATNNNELIIVIKDLVISIRQMTEAFWAFVNSK